MVDLIEHKLCMNTQVSNTGSGELAKTLKQ